MPQVTFTQATVEDLSRILGHNDINTTYLHYDKQPLDDLAIDASSIAHI
ncbi:hypothetical protein [Senegalimassilia anaerobia]|nr:hypothetical protein [Senegalimassilia anaerobia]